MEQAIDLAAPRSGYGLGVEAPAQPEAAPQPPAVKQESLDPRALADTAVPASGQPDVEEPVISSASDRTNSAPLVGEPAGFLKCATTPVSAVMCLEHTHA